MAGAGRPEDTQRKTPRSLCVLLQALVSSRVTVETRSGASLTGVLESVDGRMNVTLSDAAASTALFPSLYVAGRHIVFVHLPDSADIGSAVDAHLSKLVARKR
jgi:small nuclear ribonucleoprotein (snRNP)-like protein